MLLGRYTAGIILKWEAHSFHMSLVSPYLFHLLAVAEAERNYFSITAEPMQCPQAEGKLTWSRQRGYAIFLGGSCARFFPANTATARYHPCVPYITKCFQACSEVGLVCNTCSYGFWLFQQLLRLTPQWRTLGQRWAEKI